MQFVTHTYEKIKCAFRAIYYYFVIHKVRYKEVIICDHIGDFLFTLGYLNEYKYENDIKYLKVNCSERLHPLSEYYEGVGVVVVTEIECIDAIREFYHYRSGRFVLKKLLKAVVIEPAYEYPNLFNSMIHNQYMTLRRTICRDVLHIKREDKYFNPFDGMATDCNSSKLLFVSTSATLIDDKVDVIKEIVGQARQKGWNVESNEGEGAPYLSLVEVVKNSKRYKAVVGIRSGLLDLLALCGCKVIAIYPCGYNLVHYFSISKNNEDAQCSFDYVLTGNTMSDIKEISGLLEGI